MVRIDEKYKFQLATMGFLQVFIFPFFKGFRELEIPRRPQLQDGTELPDIFGLYVI